MTRANRRALACGCALAFAVAAGPSHAGSSDMEWLADLSGGDTEGTWSVAVFGAYETGPHHFYAGYKHFEMDLEGRAGESVTETFSGPAIAYGFSF